MLSLKLRLRRPACQVDCGLPLPHHKAGRRGPDTSAVAAPVRNKFDSTFFCRSASSQPTDYSVVSYSSAQPYSPQQLAELREDARDTIVALSSGSGRAGVAVIRISGPRAGMAYSCGTCLSCCHRHVAHHQSYMQRYGRADDVLQKVLKPGRALPQPRIAVSTEFTPYPTKIFTCVQTTWPSTMRAMLDDAIHLLPALSLWQAAASSK